MDLPVNPPVLPMLSKRVEELPTEGSWIFEPKWDGFRALVFRDKPELEIQSRDEKSLNRYFPELVDALQTQLPPRAVLDAEIVVARGSVLDFETLQLRIHPAASRVQMLAKETPASIVFFDLLSDGKRDLRDQPFERRRTLLERLLRDVAPPLHLTPATPDRATATDWFQRFEGAGLDGVMAKPASAIYQPDKRVMLKVKHERDCDCVVAGFRWYKDAKNEAIGSLLLGLYDQAGMLQHVGVCASFTAEKRKELLRFLTPYRKNALANHPWKEHAGTLTASGATAGHLPGAQSRWSRGKDPSWEPLKPELVVEVAYEHMQGPRFRHMAHFRRWRTDKRPQDCTYEQLETVPPHELKTIFAPR
ncbi:MAG: ATP-dependent DNA ligase [Acidobacteriota bacterium]